jgi:hypothetical protein
MTHDDRIMTRFVQCPSDEEIRLRQEYLQAIKLDPLGHFTRALATDDHDLLRDCLSPAVAALGWRAVLRRITSKPPSPKMSEALQTIWVTSGWNIREDIRDDVFIIEMLKRALPRYQGEEIELWRGESAKNRQHRAYGLSWSAKRTVAEMFARRGAALHLHATVVLRTIAPAEAIIAAPNHHSRYLHEDEFIVDRRRLRAVDVVERYAADPYS